MKTSKNSLGVFMLVIMLCGASCLLAQRRGSDDGNANNTRNGNPGQGRDMRNNPERDYKKENNGEGHGRDYSERDRSQWNNHDRDKNDHRIGNDWNNDRNHHERNNTNWNRDYPTRNDHWYSSDNIRHRYITYDYHRHSHPSWAPAYGYRYNTRYIYYQDYNVYYDCHRDVFVIWTGRNWVISNRVPDVMYGIDFRRTHVSGVDYWDDDFDFYLQRRRPAYISISTAW